MAKSEKFKTMIGGQALIEGIMMRGPEKDAIVVRTKEGLQTEVTARKVHPKTSPLAWPPLRGVVNFFDAQMTGVKALMRSADLSPEEADASASKLDKWLEKKMKDEKSQNMVLTITVCISLLFSIGLLFLIPMLISSVFEIWISNNLTLNLLEGLVRILIFLAYVYFSSRMPEIGRVFAYHGAEHKTISCYEAGLPLTVDNVKTQCRFHPRCGTSFLLVVVVLSILLFSVVTSGLREGIPALAAMQGTFAYRLIMVGVKLLLLPVVVSISYELNRLIGRHDNWLTGILMAPGLWLQRITTNEPDEGMIEVAITAVEAVLPEKEGADQW